MSCTILNGLSLLNRGNFIGLRRVFSLLGILFYIFSSFAVDAQVYLQVEKRNSPKTIKFSKGDMMEIKLWENPGEWLQIKIWEIRPEREQIVCDLGVYKISEIRALRSERQSRRGNAVLTTTLNFGIGTVLFSFVDLFYGRPYDWAFVGGAGIISGLGVLYKLVTKQFYYRFGKKYRLRIVDLRFQLD